MPKKIRIVSDLHIGHRASCLDDPSQLRPLSEGVDQVIFNGDTLELKYKDSPGSIDIVSELHSKLEEELNSWSAESVLITGNHDPGISDTHHLTLFDGRILVTHGDGLFKNVTPWSSNIKNLKQVSQEAYGNEENLHNYLANNKRVSLKAHILDKKYNPTLWGKLKIFLHQAWPPTTPFVILKCWKESPDRAIALAERFDLSPKFIIVGHTHNPGVWRRGDQIVFNLGSCFPWPGARCIDIEGDTLTFRRLIKRRRSIKLGAALACFHLSEANEPSTLMPSLETIR